MPAKESMSVMDPALREAAIIGDVNFLIQAISTKPSEYFLAQSSKDDNKDGIAGNIFHLAARKNKVDFFKEAMKSLDKKHKKRLVFKKDENKWTPLHVGALKGKKNHKIVQLILDYYVTLSKDGSVAKKPWMALTSGKKTPLHVALKDGKENEKSAMKILKMDVELLSGMVDKKGISPLFHALKHGFNKVAETILACPLSCISFSGKYGATPLHFAPNCSETVFRLLLNKHPECIDTIDDRGFSALHQWAEIGEAWPCKLLLSGGDYPKVRTKIFKDLLCSADKKMARTPLHIAAENKETELGQILVRGYQEQVTAGQGEIQESVSTGCSPWTIKNKSGNTPIHMALYPRAKHEELVLEILSIDPTSHKTRNNKGESPFFLAVKSGCERVAEEILRIEDPLFDMLHRNDGVTILHNLSSCSEGFAKRLLKKYWWMINLADDSRKTALDRAKKAQALWLVSMLKDPSLIVQKEYLDWTAACKRDEIPAVLAFIDHWQDLQRACCQENTTPLHHLELPSYEDLNFLKIPSIGELKNKTDHNGATPLHRALERKDILLAKVLLLDSGVERIIKDHNGRTAMDLLDELCAEDADWKIMWKQINVNSHLKTSYIQVIQHGTNLEQMQTTLSVVASLLATITFAAVITGGFNSNNNGGSLLENSPRFLIFLLADVYAMCASMLVLLCLIRSMVSNPDMAQLLVDRSVLILMHSLYATLVAFMTSIFTVIYHSSLWAAILIIVMCIIIGILSTRTILRNVTAKLIPASKTITKDWMQLLEEFVESNRHILTRNDNF